MGLCFPPNSVSTVFVTGWATPVNLMFVLVGVVDTLTEAGLTHLRSLGNRRVIVNLSAGSKYGQVMCKMYSAEGKDINQELKAMTCPMRNGAAGGTFLVAPMCGNAELRLAMHLPRSNLNFDRFAVRTHHGCVQ